MGMSYYTIERKINGKTKTIGHASSIEDAKKKIDIYWSTIEEREENKDYGVDIY